MEIKPKSNPPMQRVYQIEKDLPTVIKQIATDIREDYDQSYVTKDFGWGLPVKSLEWCDVKISGNGDGPLRVVFQVNRHHGGRRIPWADQQEMELLMKETRKILDEYVKLFRKYFKDLSGKSLRLSNQNDYCNYEKVSMNGLYRIYAHKVADVKVDLGNQEWAENYKAMKDKEVEI